MNSEPRPTYFPGVSRSPDMIASGLRETIKQLVNGILPWPLFMHGPPGVGKTCAALCLLDRCYSLGIVTFEKDGKWFGAQDQPGGIYKTSQEVCDALFGEFGRKGKPVTERTWKEWTASRLTVLDEIGAREKVGDFVYNTTKQLIDVRAGKPLIVISNLDLKALSVLYDDRLTSRLGSGTVVKLEGEDRRLQR